LKILLDECLPEPLRGRLTGHDVFTVGNLGWKGLRNGRLLAAAAAHGFDLLLTTDGSIEYQQNLTTLPLSIVVIDAASNAMADLEPLVPAVLVLLESHLSSRIYHVGP
jgi:hypothetical protein